MVSVDEVEKTLNLSLTFENISAAAARAISRPARLLPVAVRIVLIDERTGAAAAPFTCPSACMH